MAVVADLDAFPTEGDEALDVELIGRDSERVAPFLRDPLGFEHDDLAAFGGTEVVGQAIHEQMVAAVYLHPNYFLTLLIELAPIESRAPLQSRAAVIRWKHEPVGAATDFEGLEDVKHQQFYRRVHVFKLAVSFRAD